MRKLSLSLVSVAALGALVMACSDPGKTGPIAVTGGANNNGTGGTVAGAGGATTGSGGDAVGVGGDAVGSGGDAVGSGGATVGETMPLPFENGWLEADANTLGVQGAVFAYADTHTIETMMENINENGAKACITGEAFMVDKDCTVTDPMASDCYGEFWGAAIGFNLNQPKIPDPDNPDMEIGGDPEPFDLSAVSAIRFKVEGADVPTSLRFSVDGGDGVQYCTTKDTKLTPVPADGIFTVKLADLRAECWESMATSANPAPMASSIVKIAWGVVTNDKSTTPFDFCITEVAGVP